MLAEAGAGAEAERLNGILFLHRLARPFGAEAAARQRVDAEPKNAVAGLVATTAPWSELSRSPGFCVAKTSDPSYLRILRARLTTKRRIVASSKRSPSSSITNMRLRSLRLMRVHSASASRKWTGATISSRSSRIPKTTIGASRSTFVAALNIWPRLPCTQR